MIRAALLLNLAHQGFSLLEASLRGTASESILRFGSHGTGASGGEAAEGCRDYQAFPDMEERGGAAAAAAANATEVAALAGSLRYQCLGDTWDGQKCQHLAQEVRDKSWRHLVRELDGVHHLSHLPQTAPAIRKFEIGGGLGAKVNCRKDGMPAHLFYRHIYKDAGLAIKRNLAHDSGMSWRVAKDEDWGQNDRCAEYKQLKKQGKNPVLFTFVRDPVEKFIAGYREIASRGLIDRLHNSHVGTVEHAQAFIDNVFHDSCDNGHVLLQVQNFFSAACQSKFDYIGRLEQFSHDWHRLGGRAGCNTEKGLAWPTEVTHASATHDFGAEQAMRAALAQNNGKMMRALCFWVLPDIILFGYAMPAACQDHEVLQAAHAATV